MVGAVRPARWRAGAAGAAGLVLVAAAVAFNDSLRGPSQSDELVMVGVKLGEAQRLDLRQAVELGRAEHRFDQARARLKSLYGELNWVYSELQKARRDEREVEAAVHGGASSKGQRAAGTHQDGEETYQSALRGWKVLGALRSKVGLGSAVRGRNAAATAVPSLQTPPEGASRREAPIDDSDSAIEGLLRDIGKGSGLHVAAPGADEHATKVAALQKELAVLKDRAARKVRAAMQAAQAHAG